jgi:glycosyltransferase involved in cell wall biosynthesis
MKPLWHYLVEIAGCCNLSCPSCPNGNSTKATRAHGLMDVETFKKIINKISHEPVEVEYLSLYNWGEPLLNPHVAEMIEYVNSFRYRCTISSNLNNQKHLESVIRANPFQFRISLSGSTGRFYSRTHKNGNIEKVKEGMSLIRRILDESKSSTNIEVCYHKYKDNTGEELSAMKTLCDDLGFRFVPTWAYFMPLEKSIICCDDQKDQKQYPGDAFSITGEDRLLLDLLAIKPEELKMIHMPYKDRECTLRASQTAINFDGSVSLCCGVWDDRYRISQDFCAVSHTDLQRRKHSASFCEVCRNNAQHMAGINYDGRRIDETANARVNGYAQSIKPAINQHPLISVIITAYNYGRFLGKAIESVLSQDFTDFELLVLNNASTDNTDEVVKRYLDDPRIRYIVNETNIGGRANGNKGIMCSKAPYVLFLSADDILLPNTLSSLHHAMLLNNDVDFIFGRYLFIDQNGAVIQEVKHPGWLPYDHKGRQNEVADLLQFDCYISMPTVLFKRSVFERFGDFSDSVRVADYELFIRLAAKGCTSYFINKPLAEFRIHGNQMSIGGDVISSGSQINDQLTLLERYLVPEYFSKVAGYEAGMLGLLASKLEAFNRCPDRNTPAAMEIERRIQAVMAQVARLQTVEPENYPMVSVIVPTQNRPEMLKRAIESICSQTYPNFEIIVINDGGEDVEGTIRRFNIRNNIRYIRHELPRERSAARNSGLLAARGKYIAYLDDDDRFYPDHLRILVNFLETNKVKVAYTDACRANEDLENGTYVVKSRQLQFSNNFDPDKILIENLFPNLCIMHKKSCIDEAGMFDEALETHEDWEMWIRLSRLYCFHHIPVVTAEYSFRNDKTNTTSRRLAEFNITRENIYRKYRTYAKLHPSVLDAQQKALQHYQQADLHAQGIEAAATEQERQKQMIERFKGFLARITVFVEQGDFKRALGTYDDERKQFPENMPETEHVDMLMKRVRAMKHGAAAVEVKS